MAFVELNRASVLRSGKPILDSISFTIENGGHTAILGPNGSGKSTLLKLLSCQIYPMAREDDPQPVRIFGKRRWDVFSLRSRLGIVSSEMHKAFVLDDDLTAYDAVVSGFFATQGVPTSKSISKEMEADAHAALAHMGVAGLAGRTLGTLSTGEARRVLIARALAPRPKALLLDEPTTGLDLSARFQLLENLRAIAVSGTTLILITHHIEEVIPEIGRVLILRDGRITHDGSKEALLTSGVMSESFGIDLRITKIGRYFYAAPTA